MEKNVLMNEIKLIELKLSLLKAKIAGDETKTRLGTSADLYGLFRNSDDLTPEDIDGVKIRMKGGTE